MSADNELTNSRVLNYSRKLVWRAYEEPEHLTNWFGPKGFSSTFQEFNFRQGGDWKFIFHGPDGKNYDNHNVFAEIKKPAYIVFDHLSKPQIFRAEMTFENCNIGSPKGETAAKTKLTFYMIHNKPIDEKFKAFLIEKNEENLDRLEAELERMTLSDRQKRKA